MKTYQVRNNNFVKVNKGMDMMMYVAAGSCG